MGKGKRSREARAGKREELKAQALKKKRRSLIGKIIAACMAALVVLAVVAVVVYNSVAATGYFLRNTVVMSTENFKVDNAMMTYFLKNEYYSFRNTYSDYLSMYGLDTNTNLKKQTYGDSTWFNQFRDTAKNRVNNMLLSAEQAKADGLTITDEDKAEIDNTIESIKTYAEQGGLTLGQFLGRMFDKGINEGDVRRALELSMLATEYQNSFNDALNYTDEDLQNYFDEHKPDFISADYIRYTFSETPASDMDDAAKAELKASLKAKADALAASKSVNSFTSSVTDLITAAEQAEYDEAKKTAEDNGEEYNPETTVEQAVADQLENAKGSMIYPSETSEDKVAKWMFEEGREVGDTYVSEPEEDATTYNYVVYCVTKTEYYDEYASVNARHILLSTDTYGSAEEAQKKAEEILAKYNEGEKTEDAFIALAKENSEDVSVEDNGGLYENITKDSNTYPQEFIDWCYDSSRKAGDVGVVSTETGAHVIYYVGTGEVAWKVAARSGKQSQDWNNKLEELKAIYPITVKDSDINKISGELNG